MALLRIGPTISMYLIVSVAVVRDQSLFGVSPDLVLFTDLIDGV